MKKVFLSSLILTAGVASASSYKIVIENQNKNYVISSWHSISSSYSEWQYGNEYNCSEWSDTDNYNEGIQFTQIMTCNVDKTRTVQDQEERASDGSIRNVGELYTEKQTEIIEHRRDAIGTYRGISCIDIKNKGKNKGSNNYLLSTGETVYCEMTIAGGGFQLKSNRNYIPDGDLSDGTHVNTEAGSNPTNEVISMPNPVSNYVIRQAYGDPNIPTNSYTEYEIHPDVCDVHKGDYVALTLWVDQPTSVFWPFHNRFYDVNSGGYADGGYEGLIDQKVVNGKTWYQYRYMKPIPAEPRDPTTTNYESRSCHNWYVGYSSTAVPNVNIHMTGFSYQIYTR